MQEMEFQVSEPDEFTMTEDDEKVWIRRLNDSSGDLALVAELNGKVVGLIDFHCNARRKRLRHTGSFGMTVQKEFRNDGIGALLITELLAWAKSHPYIEKVGLAVLSTNACAIHLYRKLGFIEEGRRKNEIRIAPDKYVDDILMYQLVKEIP
jgi:RimJ/RimL family protein N-acetyltransferase